MCIGICKDSDLYFLEILCGESNGGGDKLVELMKCNNFVLKEK